jgi:ABC-2 type transport system permease protein
LIFISGIFIPLQELQGTGMILSYISPLTYLVDMFHPSFPVTHNVFKNFSFSFF